MLGAGYWRRDIEDARPGYGDGGVERMGTLHIRNRKHYLRDDDEL